MDEQSSKKHISPADISDAYEYHAMLVNGPGKDSDSEDSITSDEFDSDLFSDNEDEDQADDEAEESDASESESIVKMRDGLAYERENGPEEVSQFPVFLLNVDTKLTLRASGSQCSNSKSRNEMWLGAPTVALRDLRKKGLGFLDQIGQLCIQAKIHECNKSKCKKAYDLMEKIAPTCDWTHFRKWALAAMSCQACLTDEEKLTKAHTHIASAVYGLCTILQKSKAKSEKYLRPSLDGPSQEDGPKQTSIKIDTVCHLLSWMMAIQDEIVVHPGDLDGLDRKFLPPTLTLPVIEEATKELQKLGICKNRIWNLVTLSERQESDLPDFMRDLMRHKEAFKHLHGVHEVCTPTKCQQSQIDSTTVGQMHKCQQPLQCQTRTFNVDLLETSLDLGKPTAWSRLKPCLIRPNEAYIAISHVWSDGTGVGIKNAGCVNECLFDYFAKVASRLDCTGIWWDALSIPQESKARSKALNKMHSNYANALTTVVHDKYLVNFPWKDDGSPCLALVLSSWFTRGWTALELIMSGKVQVLFKDPKGGEEPVIKDLDDEVLAREPGKHTRAHWLISGFIRRLREPIDDLGDLLAILKARSTSWARDRTIIAALLLNVPDCDFTRPEGKIMRHILTHLGYIPFESLFHGHVTMADSGPWSWCVPTLDDIRLDLSKKLRGIDKDCEMLVIDKNGAITGEWGFRRLYRKEIEQLEPYGENLAVKLKVRMALRHWDQCLLLREWDKTPGPVLLATTVGVTKGGTLECRYIGRVIKKPSKQKANTTPEEVGADNENDNASEDEQQPVEALDEGIHEPEETGAAHRDNENLQADSKAAADDADVSDDDSLRSSKVDSDSDSDSSEGSEPDDVGMDDGVEEAYWEMNEIRIGNDVTKEKNKPAVDKPTFPAKLVLKTLHKIQYASIPEDENANDDDDDQDSELENLHADTSSNVSSDSDAEFPKDGADASHLKDARNDTAINTPWFSQADEYRRSELDLSFEYDQYVLEPEDERVRHLYSAINANNKKVIRHLINNKTDLKPDVKENLMILLGPQEDTFKKLKTLADVYFETSGLQDAKFMLKMVTEKLGEKHKTRASTERLESLHMLGRIFMKEKDVAKAQEIFDEVLNLCRLKNKNRDAKISAKAKASEEKAASKDSTAPTAQPNRASTFAKNPTSQLKRAPTLNTSSRTKTDSTIAASKHHNPTSKPEKGNEPNPDRKVSKWYKIEMNALADLCLLHAEVGDIPRATARYQEALKSFGKASTSVDAFKNIWGIEIDEPDPHERNIQYEEAEKTYLYALKRLEGERQIGKEHRLSLITVLNLAIVYELRKKYQEAELLYKRAHTGFKKALGDDHLLTLSSIHRLAVVSTILEKLKETDRLYQLALDGVEKRYGAYHKFTFTVICDFGNHCLVRNDPLNALKMFQRVIKGDGSPFHPYPELSLAALRDEARCYVQQNKISKAERALINALKGLREIPGQTLAACSTAFSLGVLYEEQGKLSKAADKFQYCMEEYSKSLGKGDMETLKATRRLGLIRQTTGNMPGAKILLQCAYDGYMEIEKSKATKESRKSKDFVFTHPDTLEAAQSLGSVHISLGKLKEAEELCSFAYKGLSKGLGPDDLSTLMASRSLGILYFKQLKLALSKKHLEETLEALQRKTPQEVDEALRLHVATELGITCAWIGDYEKARKLFKQAIDGFTKIATPKTNPDTEVPLFIAELKLGDLYAEQGMFDLAKKHIERAHKGFDRIQRSKHPNTLEAILSLGKLKDQPYAQAEQLLKKALDGFSKVVGQDDIRTLNTSASLGRLYMMEPVNLGKAVRLFEQAIVGYKKQPVSHHPFMLETMHQLGVAYKKQGNTPKSEKMFKEAIAGFEERFGPDHAVAFKTIMRLNFQTEPVAESPASISHSAPLIPATTPNAIENSGTGTTSSTLTGRSLPIQSVSQTKGKASAASDATLWPPTKSTTKSPAKSRRGGDPLPTPLASPENTVSVSRGGNQSRGEPHTTHAPSQPTPLESPEYTVSGSRGGNQSRGEPRTSYTPSQPTPLGSPEYTVSVSRGGSHSRGEPHKIYAPSQSTPNKPINTSNQSESRKTPPKSYNSPANEIPRPRSRITAKETESRNNESSSTSKNVHSANKPLPKQRTSREKSSGSFKPPREISRSPIPQISVRETKSYNKQSSSSTTNAYNTSTSTPYNSAAPTYNSPSPRPSQKDLHSETQSHGQSYFDLRETRKREPAQSSHGPKTCSACGTYLRHHKDIEQHLSSCPGDYFSRPGNQTSENVQQNSARREVSAAMPETEISCVMCQAILWSQDEYIHHAKEHPQEYLQYVESYGSNDTDAARLAVASYESRWLRADNRTPETRNSRYHHGEAEYRGSYGDGYDYGDYARCRTCGYSFESRNLLFTHLREWRHDDELGNGWADEIRCRKCRRSFTSKTELFAHLRIWGHEMSDDDD